MLHVTARVHTPAGRAGGRRSLRAASPAVRSPAVSGVRMVPCLGTSRGWVQPPEFLVGNWSGFWAGAALRALATAPYSSWPHGGPSQRWGGASCFDAQTRGRGQGLLGAEVTSAEQRPDACRTSLAFALLRSERPRDRCLRRGLRLPRSPAPWGAEGGRPGRREREALLSLLTNSTSVSQRTAGFFSGAVGAERHSEGAAESGRTPAVV